jgi:hypothetical protein
MRREGGVVEEGGRVVYKKGSKVVRGGELGGLVGE